MSSALFTGTSMRATSTRVFGASASLRTATRDPRSRLNTRALTLGCALVIPSATYCALGTWRPAKISNSGLLLAIELTKVAPRPPGKMAVTGMISLESLRTDRLKGQLLSISRCPGAPSCPGCKLRHSTLRLLARLHGIFRLRTLESGIYIREVALSGNALGGPYPPSCRLPG